MYLEFRVAAVLRACDDGQTKRRKLQEKNKKCHPVRQNFMHIAHRTFSFFTKSESSPTTMGKRGKAARKRRRENELSTTATSAVLTGSLLAAVASQHQYPNSNAAKKKPRAAPTNNKRKNNNNNNNNNSHSDDASSTSTTTSSVINDDNNDLPMEEEDEEDETIIGQHGISNTALEVTVATLHRLSGFIDPLTGKLALKDKRYRSLRRVLYELHTSIDGGGAAAGTGGSSFGAGKSSNSALSLFGNDGIVSRRNTTSNRNKNSINGASTSTNGENGAPLPHHHYYLSASKITNEISRQLDHGAWDSAVATLRKLRQWQQQEEENNCKQQQQQQQLQPSQSTLNNRDNPTENNTPTAAAATTTTTTTNKNKSNGKSTMPSHFLRPKLGALQRWVRQVDAAGTDDPMALEVLDAMLRVVAPETMIAVDKSDLDKATWAKLGGGVGNVSCSKSNSSNDDNDAAIDVVDYGNVGDDSYQGGRIRLFPAFDCKIMQKNSNEEGTSSLDKEYEHTHNDTLDKLVSGMQINQDGIRQVTSLSIKEHRNFLFRSCGFEKGSDRKPPNKHDLELVTTACIGETIALEDSVGACDSIGTFSKENILQTSASTTTGNITLHNRIVKTMIPYVHDSFFLENVLSPIECDRLIAAAETAGYNPDEPMAGQPGASILAHACVWIVDHPLERELFERVRKFLPSYQSSGQGQKELSQDDDETIMEPLGVNRRFRFYRYVPGRYYRPHIDGAWPPSGFDRNGNYRYDVFDKDNKNGLQFVENTNSVYDASHSLKQEDTAKQFDGEISSTAEASTMSKQINLSRRRQLSRLTFLIYLNDDFDGGHTTFLVPDKEREGVLNAFPVKPVRGGILVFPHGTCAAPLHEGSPVLKRCKYVVRTEVEYYL